MDNDRKLPRAIQYVIYQKPHIILITTIFSFYLSYNALINEINYVLKIENNVALKLYAA